MSIFGGPSNNLPTQNLPSQEEFNDYVVPNTGGMTYEQVTQSPAYQQLSPSDRMSLFIQVGNALNGSDTTLSDVVGQGLPDSFWNAIKPVAEVGGAAATLGILGAVGGAAGSAAAGGSDVAGGGSATSVPVGNTLDTSTTNEDPGSTLSSTDIPNANINTNNTPLPQSTISTITSQLASSGIPASTISSIAKLLAGAGSTIAGAETSAANSQLAQEKLGLQANEQNTSGESAYQNELINTAGENQKLENTVLNNAALQSKITDPSVSPYDVAPPTYSPAFEAAVKSAAAMPYTPIAAPTPYTPISPSGVQAATGTTPSTLQTVGQWLAPALGIASAVAPVL